MHVQKINSRVELLRDVFAFSLGTKRTLNIGQRICLSQERAAQLKSKRIFEERNEIVTPTYVLPLQLEQKVQEIANTIKETNWVKPIYKPLF